MINLLEIDWKIAKFRERKYPLEHYALKFCKAMKMNDKDGTGKMLQIFGRMKELNVTSKIMNEMLLTSDTVSKQCIVDLLGDGQAAWDTFSDLKDEKKCD